MGSKQELTQFIKAKALELGFDDVGIADARLGTPYSVEVKKAYTEGRFGPLDYMDRTVEERADIQKLMPGAKSVVMLVKNYYAGDHKDFINIEDLEQRSKPKISRYAWGRDYHSWFKKRLRKFRPERL